MKIYGMQKTTLVDFPSHVATTLFTGGCNFRCPYCHNGDLVVSLDSMDPLSVEDVFAHLEKRKNVLDGVVISGGEPTLQPDLADFIRRIKTMGYLVKLDTNGSQPQVLCQLLEEDLLDYVAMDIKHSRSKYTSIANQEDFSLDDIAQSVDLLKNSSIEHEFRITLCRELHRETDITAIGMWLMGAKACYLQPYRESDQVITPGFHPHTPQELEIFVHILSAFIEKVEIRGMD